MDRSWTIIEPFRSDAAVWQFSAGAPLELRTWRARVPAFTSDRFALAPDAWEPPV